MKSLLAGLLVITTAMGNARAAGTIPVVMDSPIEAKIVEIHMTRKTAPVIKESKRRKTGQIQTLPLAGGTCSGSFIDDVGDVLTARHCVDGFDSFEVVTSDHRSYAATVIAISDAHDLALIHIDRRNTAHFDPAASVTRGEQIFVLGSPLGITDTLSQGIIARLDGDVTLLDCSVLPGNSGGPVFNKEGKLVGVVNAGFIVLYGMTHLNMAQGLDAVVFFVREALEKRYGR